MDLTLKPAAKRMVTLLPTDILGVLAINSLMAWSWRYLGRVDPLPVANQLLTALPVDVLVARGIKLAGGFCFALFPLVAIFVGWKQSLSPPWCSDDPCSRALFHILTLNPSKSLLAW
ncbi:hypothetical protein [Klebsiella pneumoniae]|uniref:hypothetical protein n=1 Tax=Klebsiella pneumoniae TaxID=573 RepID=UPI00388D91C6